MPKTKTEDETTTQNYSREDLDTMIGEILACDGTDVRLVKKLESLHVYSTAVTFCRGIDYKSKNSGRLAHRLNLHDIEAPNGAKGWDATSAGYLIRNYLLDHPSNVKADSKPETEK